MKNLVDSLKQEIKEYKLTYQNENDKLRNELQIMGIDIDRKLEKKANKNDENIEGQLKTLYAWVSELRDQMKHRIQELVNLQQLTQTQNRSAAKYATTQPIVTSSKPSVQLQTDFDQLNKLGPSGQTDPTSNLLI